MSTLMIGPGSTTVSICKGELTISYGPRKECAHEDVLLDCYIELGKPPPVR